jgi:hypothetical protein
MAGPTLQSNTPRSSAPSTGSSMRQRFGWYFLGMALGLLFVGLLWQARYRAYQRQQAQQQQQGGPWQLGPNVPAEPAPAPAPQP